MRTILFKTFLLIAVLTHCTAITAQNAIVKPKKNVNTAEIRYLFDKYNKDISQGYTGSWNVMTKINGVRKISSDNSVIYSYGANYEGVLYMNDKPIRNSFDEPQKWSIRLEGPRAGVYCIELSCNMLGEFEDNCVNYLRNIGCKYLHSGKNTFSWYKVYSYKSIFVCVYCLGGGNAGNNIGYFLVQDSNCLSDVERYLKEHYMY